MGPEKIFQLETALQEGENNPSKAGEKFQDTLNTTGASIKKTTTPSKWKNSARPRNSFYYARP